MTQKSKTIHIIIVATLVFITLAFAAMLINVVKLVKINNHIEDLEAKIAEKNAQISQNQDEITLKESDEYIERYARELLNMKERDEKVFKGK